MSKKNKSKRKYAEPLEEMPPMGLITRIKNPEATDVDTLKGSFQRTMSFRVIGFDGPEIFKPSCEAEKIHGMAGKRRLEEIIAESDDVVAFIPASKKDKIKDILSIGGRPCAHIFADGVNIAITLINEEFSKWDDYSGLTEEKAIDIWGGYKTP